MTERTVGCRGGGMSPRRGTGGRRGRGASPRDIGRLAGCLSRELHAPVGSSGLGDRHTQRAEFRTKLAVIAAANAAVAGTAAREGRAAPRDMELNAHGDIANARDARVRGARGGGVGGGVGGGGAQGC